MVSTMVRLNKYLADSGVASRRKCDELIATGHVTVNGRVQRQLGTKVDEMNDVVRVASRLVRPVRTYEYILFHKPKDVITTVSDDRGRKTVLDFVGSKTRVFPVGRLDRDTTGLLLLTNDGDLTYRLMHPSFKVDKTYEVTLNKPLSWSDKCKLEAGIELEEGTTTACKVEMPPGTPPTFVRMIVQQGWKRQIRRMFEQLDYHVIQLKRVGFAFLGLQGLKRGQCRHLTKHEVARLKAVCNGNT